MNDISEPYPNVKIGDNVVYKEGRTIHFSIVRDIVILDSSKHFELMDKHSGETFRVAVNMLYGGAYCPWRFIPAKELSDY